MINLYFKEESEDVLEREQSPTIPEITPESWIKEVVQPCITNDSTQVFVHVTDSSEQEGAYSINLLLG